MVECKQLTVSLSISKSNSILINAKEHNNQHNNSSDNLVKFSSGIPIVKTSKYFPCSRVSSGGRTGRKTNSKTGIEEKDRFNQQQET